MFFFGAHIRCTRLYPLSLGVTRIAWRVGWLVCLKVILVNLKFSLTSYLASLLEMHLGVVWFTRTVYI
jgi:hypothetical protein